MLIFHNTLPKRRLSKIFTQTLKQQKANAASIVLLPLVPHMTRPLFVLMGSAHTHQAQRLFKIIAVPHLTVIAIRPFGFFMYILPTNLQTDKRVLTCPWECGLPTIAKGIKLELTNDRRKKRLRESTCSPHQCSSSSDNLN